MDPWVQEQNRRIWDERARRNAWYVDTATDADFQDPLSVVDPRGWFGGSVVGMKILCLAAGGGRHGPLLAAAGARVTVVDLSPVMLELDEQVARTRGLSVACVEASMTDFSTRVATDFDAVIQPVSTCYVPELGVVYAGVAAVLKSGGLYLSQHKQPAALQAMDGWLPGSVGGYPVVVACRESAPLVPAGEDAGHRERGALEFVHPLTEMLGGLCATGFVIEDVFEPWRGDVGSAIGSIKHRSAYLPPFLAIKARRTAAVARQVPRSSRLWLPGDSGDPGV